MGRMRAWCWCVACGLLLAACGPPAGGADASGAALADGGPASPPATTPRVAAAPRPDALAGERPRIVILGDSLTAGLGLPAAEAYPARLQERIDGGGWGYEIVPAAVSGDTTAGGLRRLGWALDGDVRLLVVALGGNDALRGLPVEQMRDNLAAIVDEAAGRGIGVLLAGMEAPPNFGPAYTSNFRNVFRDLAGSRDLPLLPFLLEGVAGVPALNQSDGIHPNAEGAEQVAAHVWTALEPLLGGLAGGRSGHSEHDSDRP